MHNPFKTLAAATLVMTLAACEGQQTMPEVNDANCKDEVILAIKDTEMRQEFGSKCLHRAAGKAFVPSTGRSW